MGVYVKGMKMPENCDKCHCSDDLGCAAKNIVMPSKQMSEKRPEWCPLVKVPEPHGRLIDENELTVSTDNIVSKIMIFGGQVCYSRSDIDNAPTVIEAEGNE